MKTEALLSQIIAITQEHRAQDLTILKVTEVCEFADYFVIMSGTSSIHIQTIAEKVLYHCKHMGHPAISVEGLAASEWCLLDFGAVIVHVFRPEKRAHYQLEALWKDAETLAPESLVSSSSP